MTLTQHNAFEIHALFCVVYSLLCSWMQYNCFNLSSFKNPKAIVFLKKILWNYVCAYVTCVGMFECKYRYIQKGAWDTLELQLQIDACELTHFCASNQIMILWKSNTKFLTAEPSHLVLESWFIFTHLLCLRNNSITGVLVSFYGCHMIQEN